MGSKLQLSILIINSSRLSISNKLLSEQAEWSEKVFSIHNHVYKVINIKITIFCICI